MPADRPGDPTPRAQIRADVTRARAARSPLQQQSDDRMRDARVVTLLASLLDDLRTPVVACYLSRPGEPGTSGLLTAWAGRARLLVPKLGRRPDGSPRREPDWAWLDYSRPTTTGPFSIPDPDSDGLGAAALQQADVVIVAALAADEDGSRIGTGGGWFDRALLLRRPDAPVIALLNDDEVRPCPTEPHDQPVDWIVTPTRTIRCVPRLATG